MKKLRTATLAAALLAATFQASQPLLRLGVLVFMEEALAASTEEVGVMADGVAEVGAGAALD